MPLRVLYLGRLERTAKRVHLFPQIFEQLKLSGIPFHWTIAGDGSAREFLEAGIKTESAQQTIAFTGRVDYADVPELLKRHDICLLTSDYESFGLSVAEAMSCGLVPVVSDLPSGIPEMVNPSTGLLVPVDDVAGYARAIIHLHHHREELAAKSAAARQLVRKKFSVEAMADRWLAVLPGPKAIEPWPRHWCIQAPITARPLYFSPPLRILRRLAMRLRR